MVYVPAAANDPTINRTLQEVSPTMCARQAESRKDVKKSSRVTKEQADEEAIGAPKDGVRLPASSYAGDDGTSFLGVDEPVLDADERGAPPPAPSLPTLDPDA
jgi:hypothetical protein